MSTVHKLRYKVGTEVIAEVDALQEERSSDAARPGYTEIDERCGSRAVPCFARLNNAHCNGSHAVVETSGATSCALDGPDVFDG